MPIHLFNAKRLAQELGRGEVGPKVRAYYLLASFLIFTVFTYSGLISANPLWSWLSLYEAFLVAVVMVIGLSKAYDAAGAESNPDFVAQFTCLYVPVSVTTILVVWSCYWALLTGFRESILALSESHLQIALNLSKIGTDFFGAITLLAAIFAQIVTFYRITKLFYVVRKLRS